MSKAGGSPPPVHRLLEPLAKPADAPVGYSETEEAGSFLVERAFGLG
jgi:hypothetical protein